MTEELKDCPFCGSNVLYVNEIYPEHRNDDVWSVDCYNCDAKTGMKWTRELAVEAWNERAG